MRFHRLAVLCKHVVDPHRDQRLLRGLDLYKRAATYVDRILKGNKPRAPSVEQPTTFELLVNLKTAKAVGITMPPMLLARVDELIA